MNLENSLKWVARSDAVMAEFGKLNYYPFVMKSGRGSIVEDVDGNQYIDLFASGGSLNVGHCHPKVVAAVEEQIHQYFNCSSPYFYNPKAIEYAEKLTEIAPGRFAKRVGFGLTGSDANDGAIKIARAYTGRSRILSFVGAYHGTTFGALSLTNISLNMRRKIGAILPDVYAFPYPNVYHDGPEAVERCLEEIRRAFTTYIPPDEVAAVMFEVIQGDTGLLIPTQEFVQGIADICKEHGILLVTEEVQQGFMRTGEWFSIDNFGIVPDMMVLAKSLGGGLPHSAIVGRADVMEALESPAHLLTFAGNPVCCAAGLAQLEVLSDPDFQRDMRERSAYMKALLLEVRNRHEVIGEVRALGFTIGVELVKDRGSKERDNEAASKVCYRAWERGVLMVTLGGNVLRIQPPLIITREEIERSVSIIDEALSDYENGRIPDSVLKYMGGWGKP